MLGPDAPHCVTPSAFQDMHKTQMLVGGVVSRMLAQGTFAQGMLSMKDAANILNLERVWDRDAVESNDSELCDSNRAIPSSL